MEQQLSSLGEREQCLKNKKEQKWLELQNVSVIKVKQTMKGIAK